MIPSKKIHDLVREEEAHLTLEKSFLCLTTFTEGVFGPGEEKIYGKNNWYDWSWENWELNGTVATLIVIGSPIALNTVLRPHGALVSL